MNSLGILLFLRVVDLFAGCVKWCNPGLNTSSTEVGIYT